MTGLRDAAGRYDQLSGVENEVERSSTKREVSPEAYSSKFNLTLNLDTSAMLVSLGLRTF